MIAFRNAVLVGTLALAGGATLHAQGVARGTIEGGASRPRGGAQMAGIELTPAQRTKLDAIAAKYAAENRSFRDSAQGDPAVMFKRMMAVRDRMVPELRAVLTPEQQAIFDRNMAAMKTRLDAMMKPPET